MAGNEESSPMGNDGDHRTTSRTSMPTTRPNDRCISGLPDSIMADILSRLPTKSIFASRCVCKTWLSLTSFDPIFADLHLSRSPLELLVKSQTLGRLSSTVHLLDPEFECNGSSLEREIEIKPRLSLRKLETDENLSSVAVVNSCRGFLCLSDALGNNPSVVCNPVTDEYIRLPKPKDDQRMESVKYSGLGFCPDTKQFKVLRMFYTMNCDDPTQISLYRMAEIHVLGSDLWRGIGHAPISPYRATYTVFLNGALHWDCDDAYSRDFIVSFDFVNERFGKIPPPSSFAKKQKRSRDMISLGVLGEYLYLCDANPMMRIDVWLMKEYGVQESWSKDYAIDKYYIDPVVVYERQYRPVKFLRNGEMLMVCPGNYLICFDPMKKSCRYFKFREVQSQLEVIFHTPSFASLKDVVIGGNAEVLNLRPRSEEVVEGEETETLFLVPEEDSVVEEMALLFNECKSYYTDD